MLRVALKQVRLQPMLIICIRFGPFVDMKKEEWSKKVLLDKFGRVYFVFVSQKS